MKFIYISPLKSQNITNFTFWKVNFLEIREVHLKQASKSLGSSRKMDVLSPAPRMRRVELPPTLRGDLNSGGQRQCPRIERSGPYHPLRDTHQTSRTAPGGPVAFAGSVLEGREGQSSNALAPSRRSENTATFRLEVRPENQIQPHAPSGRQLSALFMTICEIAFKLPELLPKLVSGRQLHSRASQKRHRVNSSLSWH